MNTATNQPDNGAYLQNKFDMLMDAHDALTLAQDVLGKLSVILVQIERETEEHTQANGLARIGSYLVFETADSINDEVHRLERLHERHRNAKESAAGGAS